VHQVIVSDDGDDDTARAICEEFGVTYLRGPRRGLCANRNNAISEVTGTHVLFLDDDARLGKDFLARAITRLDRMRRESGNDMVIVTGRELRPDGHRTEARDQSFLGFQEVAYSPLSEMHTVVINAALFPASLFERIRFDEQIRYGYDEVDVTTRAVALGYYIAAEPDAINEHRPSPTSRDGYDRVIDASRLYVTLKRYAQTDRSPMRALAFCIVAPTHLFAAAIKAAGPRGALGAFAALRLTATQLRAARG
jgi:glycosyltransferase involved in cell wall biosynthesis